MEHNRLERADAATGKSIKAVLRTLQHQLEQVEQDIDRSIRNTPIWQAKCELLASMKGIGAISCSAPAGLAARARPLLAPKDLRLGGCSTL